MKLPDDHLSFTARYSTFGNMIPFGVGVMFKSQRAVFWNQHGGRLDATHDELKVMVANHTLESWLRTELLGESSTLER